MPTRRVSLLSGLLLLIPTLSAALTFPLPPEGNDLVGEVRTIAAVYEDTLSDIARRNDLGFLEITTANPDVDPWLPGEGTKVVLPSRFILPPGPREGVVINLAELRLYYYPANRAEVITHPLGIGREGWSTPTGKAKITDKKHLPSWRPPESIRAEHAENGDPLPELVKPGPDNPLGDYALYLSMPGYLLHGTNKPYGVGMRVSHGCIRLYPEDIESLFQQLPVDTPVNIINEPYKAGWLNGELYVEAHPPLSEQLVEQGQNHTPMVRAIIKALKDTAIKPDWQAVTQAVKKQVGIPFPIPVTTQ
ncbi:MAG: L,D-transpeptidase family protein [Chromatiales bacterium]|nr:L,D-transpeptidase family protein [Chromatiales bacterium]